jgi:hypothetical protein
MYKSAVNLGAAGHDPVRYMQDGGDVTLIDLQTTAPGSDPSYLDYMAPEPRITPEMPEEGGMGSVFLGQVDWW